MDKKQRRKRSLLASTGTFNAVYTPSEEVIVKLNNADNNNNNKIAHSLPLPSNHLLNELEHKTRVNQLIEGTTSHAALNANHHHQQQHQKKSSSSSSSSPYFLLDDFATNSDDGDNGLMNDYGMDYYVDASQRSKNNKMHENKQRWMKSSRDLSQNRDAGNLARGSGTSLLF